MNCNNKQIFLHFYGYTWEEYSFQLPSMKGIYVVYGGKLSCEGEIELHNVLYIGFHESISEMFDRGVFENIRRQSSPYDRFFLAYAEFHDIEKGKAIVQKLNDAVQVMHPMITSSDADTLGNVKIYCEGSCALFPKEI